MTRQCNEMTGQTGWFRSPHIWPLLADVTEHELILTPRGNAEAGVSK
ncbi:hypothetical protein ACIGKQ_16445 [Gordonia sp. NPDC062954]